MKIHLKLGNGPSRTIEAKKVRLLPEEEAMTVEQLAEHWNERSASMGRNDRWGVIDGTFQKTHWDGKKIEDSNYHYLLIEGVLYHSID